MKSKLVEKNVINRWSKEKVRHFQEDFLTWYELAKRTLPWRENSQPYRIWISEIMLQQTRVETVIPYFYRFMEWFPNIQELAEAPEDKLLKAWEGLGYYSRARNLQKAAQQIMSEYGGEMPSNITEIAKLKGIGPYTSGAIASMAFNQAVPAIDGNVMRVFSRLFSLTEDIAKPASRTIFEEVVRLTISHQYPGEFNQAIMDLGSAICTPTTPKCEICPIQKYCSAHEEGNQEQFPVKTKKAKAKPVYYLTCAIQNHQGEYLLERRPSKGLLANMWCFPLIEVTAEQYQLLEKKWRDYQKQQVDVLQLDLVAELTEDYLEQNYHFTNVADLLNKEIPGGKIVWQKQPLGEVTHIFSHLKWHVLLVYGLVIPEKKIDLEENQKWVSVETFNEFILPKHQHKINELLLGKVK